MRPNPYGDFGTTVTGTRFIGRTGELRMIENRIFGPRGFGSMAVVGLPRIGKTSLVSEAVRRARARCPELRHVVARANVGAFASFDDLLRSVIMDLADEVRSQNLGNDVIESLITQAFASPNLDFNRVQNLFKSLRRAEIRPVCILDEFDAGRRVFSGTPHCFHWLRELCSNPQFKAAVRTHHQAPPAGCRATRRT